ncbi:DeSI-like protein [Acorus gramineus]|uniref:DeSI-like protein n=1 Tax=Acorus gramineus TaxID=55184 RepID=A0AAV9AXP3_ACOGR|nr:DeSI-like protein [Acorus gramineus]
MSFRGLTAKRRTGASPVHLNVYDLTPFNGYAYWLGLGIYHSGVQVHGVEYAYGAHEYPTTGIFEGEPRQCPEFTFRKSILIGRTNLTQKEVRSLIERLAIDYTGNSYSLIAKNCNHFCNDLCLRLTGRSIPSWVNRLAKLGFLCNCVLPVNVEAVTLKSAAGEDKWKNGGGGGGERRRLKNDSSSRAASDPDPDPDPISRGRRSRGGSSSSLKL